MFFVCYLVLFLFPKGGKTEIGLSQVSIEGKINTFTFQCVFDLDFNENLNVGPSYGV